ncbi:hypothetical protein SHIRM173S_13264 [Streptomyces hirsutus]
MRVGRRVRWDIRAGCSRRRVPRARRRGGPEGRTARGRTARAADRRHAGATRCRGPAGPVPARRRRCAARIDRSGMGGGFPTGSVVCPPCCPRLRGRMGIIEPPRIAVAGASGLIGGALVRSLTADGHRVVRLVRRTPRAENEVRWDPERGSVDAAGLAGCDAVVNLAGAGVGDHRWTPEYKARIRNGRVRGTEGRLRRGVRRDGAGRTAAGVRERQRDRLLRRRPATGPSTRARRRVRASCRSCASSGRPPRHRPRRRACERRSPGPGSWWPAGAGRGAGSSRCSGPGWADGWATGGSTGRTSPCTTRWPPCAICSTPTGCPVRST